LINTARELPLPEKAHGEGQHPVCAEDRNRSKAWINTMCQKLNLSRYNLSMSRSEAKAGLPGDKHLYELKDTQSKLVHGTVPNVNSDRNVGIVMIDVMNHLTDAQLRDIGGHTWLGHTFYPRVVAGRQPDSGFGPETEDKWFHWTYASEDRTSERPWALREVFAATGWDEPRGPLERAVTKLAWIFGLERQVPRIYVYTCYHRRVSDSHVAFVAFPHGRVRVSYVILSSLLGLMVPQMAMSWWAGHSLKRLQSTRKKFVKGERSIVGFSLGSQGVTNSSITWAMAGSDICYPIDRAAVEAIQMLSATTSQGATLHNAQNVLPRVGGKLVEAREAVATLVYSQCGPVEQPTEPGPLINSYRSSTTQDIKPMSVVTLCLCPVANTAFAAEVSNTEELFTQMYRSTQPSEEAVMYTCVTMSDTAKNMSYVTEFTELIVEDVLAKHGKLAAPWDEATVREALNTQSQATMFEKGALSKQDDESCCNESFTKNERYAAPKMARKIEPMDAKLKLELARYAKGLADVLSALDWWGPGKKPSEIDQRLAEMFTESEFLNFGDGVIHDGHHEQRWAYIFMKITTALWEPPYRARWQQLCALPFFRRIFSVLMKIIAAYEMGSGDPKTTVCNTFSTGTGDYVSLRLDGYSPKTAYQAMGISYGDDIANRASRASTVEAFRWLGFKHEYESYKRNEAGGNFLSRFKGPLAWCGSKDSMANPRRAMISLCYAGHVPVGWTKEQLLVAKCLGYIETDAYTPMVGAFCASVIAMAVNAKMEMPSKERREEVSWNAQFTGNNWVSQSCCSHSSVDVVNRLRESLRLANTGDAIVDLSVVAAECWVPDWKWDVSAKWVPFYEAGGIFDWLWEKSANGPILKYSLAQLVARETGRPPFCAETPALTKVVNEVAYSAEEPTVAAAAIEKANAQNKFRRNGPQRKELEELLKKAPDGQWTDEAVDAYCQAFFKTQLDPDAMYVASLRMIRNELATGDSDVAALWKTRADVLQRNYNAYKREGNPLVAAASGKGKEEEANPKQPERTSEVAVLSAKPTYLAATTAEAMQPVKTGAVKALVTRPGKGSSTATKAPRRSSK